MQTINCHLLKSIKYSSNIYSEPRDSESALLILNKGGCRPVLVLKASQSVFKAMREYLANVSVEFDQYFASSRKVVIRGLGNSDDVTTELHHVHLQFGLDGYGCCRDS